MVCVEILIKKALEVQKYSYSPYSNFKVGAALLTESGLVFTGCNVENVAFSPTICGERNAIFKAVSEGERNFRAIALVGSRDGEVAQNFCPPCGVCLQVMMEFCDPDSFEIVLVKTESDYKIMKLKDFLPFSFGKTLF